MAFPVASGAQSMSGTYIPTLWAPRLLIKFYERTVMQSIANTDYEGLIKKYGDTVTINLLPDITINDYVKGQELDYEDPATTSLDLLIDKGKAYAFNVPRVDQVQSMIKFVDEWAGDAAKQMQISVERSIYADIYSDADTSNAGNTAGAISGDIVLGASGSPVTITEANIVEYLLRMGTCLDEQNVPDEDRWALLPSWACAKLKNSELKDASLTGDGRSTLRTGMIGMIDRFKIYQTNLLSTGTDGADKVTNIMAGHKSALTFAAQLTENEMITNPKDFGKLARGLCVYGYKVVKDDALVHGYVTS